MSAFQAEDRGSNPLGGAKAPTVGSEFFVGQGMVYRVEMAITRLTLGEAAMGVMWEDVG